MKTLLVAGSRSFAHWSQEKMNDLLSQASSCLDMTFDRIMEGGAPGVDTKSRYWAQGKGYPVETVPAQWDLFGKSAGYKRNVEMVEAADAVIIIWDGKSKGTKHTLNLATKKGIPMVVVIRDPKR